MKKARSLYVHIPFCRHLCDYCDFPKVLLSTGYTDRYIEALLKEDERYRGFRFDTIYIGGGTPSAIGPEKLSSLIEELISRHGKPSEFTVECNPEDVDVSLAEALFTSGINRVSLGVQSVRDDILHSLGRYHSIEQAGEALERLRRVGISNVSCDFIYGLPGESLRDVDRDCDWVRDHRLVHSSFYALELKPHTALFNRGIEEPDDDRLADMYDLIHMRLGEMGLHRYEVSNFCIPGYESQHNLCYWKGDPYAAIGYGASSYEDGCREVRTRNMTDYLEGKYIASSVQESPAEQEFDYLMCNLSKADGFSLSDYSDRFGGSFLERYSDRLERVRDDVVVSADRVAVRPEKLYVVNSILLELLDFSSLGR